MLVNIYKYTDEGGHDCVGAERVQTVEVEVFPCNQAEFASEYGGDFIEIEEQDDTVHWAGALQADRERHLRELFAEGIEGTEGLG